MSEIKDKQRIRLTGKQFRKILKQVAETIGKREVLSVGIEKTRKDIDIDIVFRKEV